MCKTEIDWYCDNCDVHLNKQNGITEESGIWECKKCGYINDLTAENILSEEEMDCLYQEECPKCGGELAKIICCNNKWECEDCGCIVEDEGYGVLWYYDNENET